MEHLEIQKVPFPAFPARTVARARHGGVVRPGRHWGYPHVNHHHSLNQGGENNHNKTKITFAGSTTRTKSWQRCQGVTPIFFSPLLLQSERAAPGCAGRGMPQLWNSCQGPPRTARGCPGPRPRTPSPLSEPGRAVPGTHPLRGLRGEDRRGRRPGERGLGEERGRGGGEEAAGGTRGGGFKPRGGQRETSGGGSCARLYPMPPRQPRAAAELGSVSRVGRRRGGCDTVTSAARQPCAGGGGPGQPRQRRPPAHGIDGAAVTHTRELVTGRHRAGGDGGSAPPPARPAANGAPRTAGLAGWMANGSAGRPPAAERPLRPCESSEDTPPPSAGEGRREPRGAGPARRPDRQPIGSEGRVDWRGGWPMESARGRGGEMLTQGAGAVAAGGGTTAGPGGAGASETPGRGRARSGAACRAGGGWGGSGLAPAPPRSFPAGGRRAGPGPAPGEAGEAPPAAVKSLGKRLGEPRLPSGHRCLEVGSCGLLPVFDRCCGSRSRLFFDCDRFLENKAHPGIPYGIRI